MQPRLVTGFDRYIHVICVALCGWLGVAATAQADNRWQAQILEPPPEFDSVGVQQISTNGSILAGRLCDINYNCSAFVWSEAAGYRTIILPGDTQSDFVALSADGATALGRSCLGTTCRGVLWREGKGMETLILPGDSSLGRSSDEILAMSEDGSTVIGYSLGNGVTRGFAWTEETGIVPLILAGDARVRGLTVAPQGATVGGRSCPTQVSTACRAFVWTAQSGMTPLFLPGDTRSGRTLVSSDGATAISISYGLYTTGLIWTLDGQIINLGRNRVPGLVSDDGSVVVGSSFGVPFAWTPEVPYQLLGDQQNIRVEGLAGNGFVWGDFPEGVVRRAFLWTEEQKLQPIELGGETASRVYRVAPNGTAAGWSSYDDDLSRLFRGWIRGVDGALHELILEGRPDADTRPFYISDDGLTAVGPTNFDGEQKNFIWTKNLGAEVLILDDDIRSVVNYDSIPKNGSTVIGLSCYPFDDCRPFAWTASLGIQNLAIDGYASIWAYLVSQNGSVIVGEACDDVAGCDSVIWSLAQESVESTEGMVTGGGWIASTTGVGAAAAAKADRTTFGFVSRYEKGNDAPTGNVQLQVEGFNFKASHQEWLVIDGPSARLQAVGTINGAGSYKVILTVIDGKVTPGRSVDQIHIKLWNTDDGAVVYDKQADLSGGSIVIHKAPRGRR